MDPNPWMTPTEAAERLGISLLDVWRWQAAGRLVLDRTRPLGAWLCVPVCSVCAESLNEGPCYHTDHSPRPGTMQ